MKDTLDISPGTREIIENGVQEKPDEAIHRVNRQIFTDEEIFELEMKYIFENNWIYLAHERQIPEIGDYYTTYIGRHPVVITRDKDGGLNCIINACAHRGAMLCRRKTDNRTTFTCPFHGWTFRNTGELLKVKDGRKGGYPEGFNTNGSHDLTKVARFESYRGFLFGSLSSDVPPLEEHLGDTRVIIDSIVDQSPDGLEVLKGETSYTYDGNWKLQAENGADGYHVTSVHWNYAATTARRKSGESENDTKAMDAGGWGKVNGGFYSFPRGHLLLWQEWTNPEDRSLWDQRDRLVDEYGETMANFMTNISRNLCLYPNVYLMDQFSSQIRVIRPISAHKTEVTTYCIAPVGEPADARSNRIRQYEDFFNATGMATPDDLEEFRSAQKTHQASQAPWNDMSRGQTHQIDGPDEQARGLGMNPLASGVKTEDEGLYPIQHAYWQQVMTEAVTQEDQRSAAVAADSKPTTR